MKSRQNTLITAVVVLAGLAALALGLYFAMQSKPAVSKNVHVYQQARDLQAFTLTDQNGQMFTNSDLKGKWSLLFLGYLSCPDICPTTMMKLSQLLPDLTKLKPNTQVLFLSVDPKRDMVENVRQYTSYFHADILGLRAEHKELYPVVRNLGLMYSIPPSDVSESYYVDHSGSVVLIDPQGQIKAMFKPKIELGSVPSIDTTMLLNDFDVITSQ